MTPVPLDGIRVLDLTSVVVGPSCTLRLADYCAEVIKLEPPSGDVLRTLGGSAPSGQFSGKYLHFNRKKRAFYLDLKQQAARDVLLRVPDRCDVLVSNMRPDALARLGLYAERARATRPRLVHCTIAGFGPGGPYRGRPMTRSSSRFPASRAWRNGGMARRGDPGSPVPPGADRSGGRHRGPPCTRPWRRSS